MPNIKFLHSQTPVLVHRDITLKNILYLDHHIYLIDFDISRFYSSTKNKDTHIFSTRGYLAPEQYGYAQSSIASDIYQLGVIFNLLLTDFFQMSICTKENTLKLFQVCYI